MNNGSFSTIFLSFLSLCSKETKLGRFLAQDLQHRQQSPSHISSYLKNVAIAVWGNSNADPNFKKMPFQDIGPALLQTVSLNKLLRWTDRQIVSQGAKNVAKRQEKTCS